MVANEKTVSGPEYPIYALTPHDVVTLWDKIEPILAKAVVPETGWNTDAVLYAVQMGNVQLWLVGDFLGVVITEVQSRPIERVLWVQFMAGDGFLDEWVDAWIETQDEYARQMGCTAVEFQSPRKAWKRIQKRFPEHTSEYAIYRKRVE